MTRVVADTNLFYFLGNQSLTKSDIVQEGERLWATPVNVLEVAAGLGGKEFELRKAAAQAILTHADGIMPDPETHMARLFGFTKETPATSIPWLDACKAIACANSAEEIEAGVSDFEERVVRSVK